LFRDIPPLTRDDDGNASESDGLGGWDEDDLEGLFPAFAFG